MNLEANLARKSKGSRLLKTRLDHLFVLADYEDQAALPERAGFPVHRRGPHRGGGSGNVVYRFGNGLLELAYPIDHREIAALGEIGFAERWRWRENGYSPFGVVLQIEDDSELPFPTWEYSPPFLPRSRWVIGDAGRREPLYMIVPYDEEHQLLAKTADIVSVEISCSGLAGPSAIASWLDDADIARIVSSGETAMIVGFSGSSLETLDLHPEVPLVLQNMTGRSVTG